MSGNELAKTFYLLRKFEELNMKQNQSNSILSRLLSLYNFHSPINRRIIFHSLSQSWLLALTKQFKNKLIEEGNLQFNLILFEEIFLFFISTNVNLNYFYENIKKWVYRTNHTTLSLMEFKLAQMFIEKIEENKKQSTIIGDIYPKTKKDFEERIMRIIAITVNYTLNELDSQEDNKTNLFLYTTFNSIYKKDLNKTCKYQLFMNQIIREKEKDKQSQRENDLSDISNANLSLAKVQNVTLYNMKLAKLFFALANTNYVDLLSDVRYFVFTNSAWNQKIGLIVKSILNNKQNVLFRFAYFTIRNLFDAIYYQTKSLSNSSLSLTHFGLSSKKNKSQMSLIKPIFKTVYSAQSIIRNIIDWNVSKLNDIKYSSWSIVYSLFIRTFKLPSLSDKTHSNQITPKKSLCERCSCLYLSHFSFEYESTGSRTNSFISDINIV